MRPAAARVGADVVEVDEWVVFLSVWIAVADEARRWHRLHVGLPRAAARLEVVSDVGCGDPACGAVRRDAIRAAACEREVVRKAGMRYGEVVGGQPVGRQAAV